MHIEKCNSHPFPGWKYKKYSKVDQGAIHLWYYLGLVCKCARILKLN